MLKCIKGSNWYRVYSDGWKEQGGLSSGSSGTINFLTSYKNTNYNLQVTPKGHISNDYISIYVVIKSTIAFEYGLGGDLQVADGCYWYACGY